MIEKRHAVLGIGLLVLISAGGASVVGAAPANVDQWDWPWDDDGDEWSDDDINLSEVSVNSSEALNTATNETNATPVGLELDSEDDTPVYDILTVGTDNVTTVTIDATNGTVVETSVEDDEDEFEDLRALNLSELRSATDAVAIAQNETAGTVTEVELEADEGLSIYEVEVVADDDTETTVYVAASEGPVLGVYTEGDENESDD